MDPSQTLHSPTTPARPEKPPLHSNQPSVYSGNPDPYPHEVNPTIIFPYVHDFTIIILKKAFDNVYYIETHRTVFEINNTNRTNIPAK